MRVHITNFKIPLKIVAFIFSVLELGLAFAKLESLERKGLGELVNTLVLFTKFSSTIFLFHN